MGRGSSAERLSRPEAYRTVAFLMTGGSAAVVDVPIRVGFDLATPYEAAVLVADLFGMTTAFLLARLSVFDGSGRSLRVGYGRFGSADAAALLQVLAISVDLASTGRAHRPPDRRARPRAGRLSRPQALPPRLTAERSQRSSVETQRAS